MGIFSKDRLGETLQYLGATGQDTVAGFNGEEGGHVAKLNAMLQQRRKSAASQSALAQVSAQITDPQEKAVFAADPDTWFKIYGERKKPQTLSEGQTLVQGGKPVLTTDKTGMDAGFAYRLGPGGLNVLGQRPESYGEVQTRQQNDPSTLGGDAWKRTQDNILGLGQLDVSRGQLGVSQGQLGVARGQLGVAQGQLGLSRDRFAFDQSPASKTSAVPSGYRLNPDGSMSFIPGGPADPNVAKRAAPTEDQAKTEFNLTRMKNASATIDKLEGGGYNRAGAFAVPGFLPSHAGDSKRQYDSRAEEWADGIIRLTTGAAATKQEMDSVKKQYFPSVGDSPAVIASKAAARKVAERAAEQRAGPAGSASMPGAVRKYNPATGKIE